MTKDIYQHAPAAPQGPPKIKVHKTLENVDYLPYLENNFSVKAKNNDKISPLPSKNKQS